MTRKRSREGACASCRKEIPLVPGDQGDLVLRTHHIVTGTQGYDVESCPGSRTAPSSLDDSKDWAWGAPSTAPPPEDQAATLNEAAQRFAATLGEAHRHATTAATAFALIPDGVERQTDFTDETAQATDGDELLRSITTAVQQACSDAVGDPPDFEISLDRDVWPCMLALRLPVGGEQLTVNIRVDRALVHNPLAREVIARQAGDTVADRLRERLNCGARCGMHTCQSGGPHRMHRCGDPDCSMTWTNLEATHGTS